MGIPGGSRQGPDWLIAERDRHASELAALRKAAWALVDEWGSPYCSRVDMNVAADAVFTLLGARREGE